MAAVPAVALAGLPLGGSTAGAATGWVGTATKADPLVQAADLGREPGPTPLHVDVALNLRDGAALEHSVAAGTVLTPAQFVGSYAPTSAQVASVVSYLTAHGFTNVSAASNRLLVTADGTVAQASTAFDTVIEQYRQNGRVVYANSVDARVPAGLGGVVSAVLGLDDVGVMEAQPTVAGDPPSSCTVSGVGYPCTYAPQGFWRAYDAVGAPTGAATNIAIFAEGNLTGVVKDLRTEETAAKLPQVPVSVVQVGAKSTDTSGADEFDLDTQFSTGMAGTVKHLYIYDAASLDDAALTASFNRFAAQGVAKAGSASFGECEFQAKLDGSLVADDHAFLEAASQGQTVFASAGDTGGFCPVGTAVNGVPAGAPDVSYPASSPWVVGVGGTTLVTTATGTYQRELAWAAGGGGPSVFEAEPAYQDGVAPKLGTVCGASTVACGRTVPDVAMDADPNSGANVYVGGTPEGVGGTSLSSPLALGVWARLESAHANGVGFANPRFYAVHSSAAFHDVEIGDTGPYPATPGYDLATGIGTFDVAKLVATIK
jgi:pseudomonalisin